MDDIAKVNDNRQVSPSTAMSPEGQQTIAVGVDPNMRRVRLVARGEPGRPRVGPRSSSGSMHQLDVASQQEKTRKKTKPTVASNTVRNWEQGRHFPSPKKWAAYLRLTRKTAADVIQALVPYTEHYFKRQLEHFERDMMPAKVTQAGEIIDFHVDALFHISAEVRTTVTGSFWPFQEVWKMERVHVITGDTVRPTATVRLLHQGGARVEDAAVGDGAVDAAYRALNRIVGLSNEVTEYSVKSITKKTELWEETLGEVAVRIDVNGCSYPGRGSDTDIVVASAKAYLNALNRALTFMRLGSPLWSKYPHRCWDADDDAR